MRAIVTAGGTSEAVDDVRVLTNRSTGRFGVALAVALSELGVDVTLIASSSAQVRDFGGELLRFESTADLQQRLRDSAQRPADLLFMAAAVSDYGVDACVGKMSSSEAEKSLKLRRNPKLLDGLRELYGERCGIVGFKLLSGVERGELERVARGQNERAALMGTVANDFAELSEQSHPVLWVPAGAGAAERLEGPREEVARALAVLACKSLGARFPEAPFRCFEASYKAWAVHSWELGLDDSKSSQGSIESEARSLLRSLSGTRVRHLAWSAGFFVISDEDPRAACISAKLCERARRGQYHGGGFSALDKDRGVIGLTGDEVLDWSARWPGLCQEMEAVLKDLWPAEARWSLYPVFHGIRLVGLVARHKSSGAVCPWLSPELRGQGLGEQLFDLIDHRGLDMAMSRGAERWRKVCIARGFTQAREVDGVLVLRAPSTRMDRRPAASIALFHPLSRTVLIGRRKTQPWKGYWSFPGGRCEVGETLLETAKRELFEETGVTAPEYEPVGTRSVFVGWGDEGETLFEVTNHQVLTLNRQEPKVTSEMAARWVPIEEALLLRPMGAGTRRILRYAAEVFAQK